MGHRYIKRLFIDKQFKVNPDNPEENEDPNDYSFIFATVEDNTALLNSPGGKNYLRQLASLPESVRKAYRYGDWSAIGGNYFPEFSPARHVVQPFKVPSHWTLYRSADYGLDCLAVYWWAIDEDGRAWAIREYTEKNLIAQDAAKAIIEHTLPTEKISITYAPPDLWSRMKETGKTIAEVFALNDVPLFKSDNNRVQGHMILKDMMADIPVTDAFVAERFAKDGKPCDKLPGIMFFDVCKNVIGDLQDIQADEKNPNDCAKEPHDLTHTVDSCRYMAINRAISAAQSKAPTRQSLNDYFDHIGEKEQSYQDFICGGEPTAEYMGVG